RAARPEAMDRGVLSHGWMPSMPEIRGAGKFLSDRKWSGKQAAADRRAGTALRCLAPARRFFRERPVDRAAPILHEKRIGPRKMAATEEAIVRREGRGVRRAQNQMASTLCHVTNEARLFLGVGAPEQEGDRCLLL